MFTNIEKELKKQKETLMKDFEGDRLLQQVKLLEQADAAEDLRISAGLGKMHSLAIAQDRKSSQMELEKLDGKYSGNVFTRQQIRRLCARYDLLFRKSEHFRGNIDMSAISAIKEFAKKTETNISEAVLSYRFYIMAPGNMFTREPRISYAHGALNAFRAFVDSFSDPAIFYKIDEDHYRLVKKWGKDFTIVRLLRGLYFRSPFGMVMINLLAFAALGIGMAKTFARFVPSWWNAPETKNWFSGEALTIMGIVVVCAIGMLIASCSRSESDFHERKWRGYSS